MDTLQKNTLVELLNVDSTVQIAQKVVVRGFVQAAFVMNDRLKYAVELVMGFYNYNENIYVSHLIVDATNVVVVSDAAATS